MERILCSKIPFLFGESKRKTLSPSFKGGMKEEYVKKIKPGFTILRPGFRISYHFSPHLKKVNHTILN
jgi:hypothetical protein